MSGSIEKRGNNKYRLIVSCGMDGNGKQVKKTKTVTCSDSKEAEKQLAIFITAVDTGNIATSGKMTLTQFYDYWKNNYALKTHEAATITYNDAIFFRIKATLGHKRLDKIEPKHLLAFYQNLAEPGIRIDPNEKKRKPKEQKTIAISEQAQAEDANEKPKPDTLSTTTIKKHHVLLSTLFNQAVKWNLIPSSPASRVEPPKVKSIKKAVYDNEITSIFLKALEGEELKYRLMCFLALTGGLCREEIFGLEWKDVNLDNGTLLIDRASIYVVGTGIITKDCKNTHRHRMVSIPLLTVELLKQYQVVEISKKNELDDKWQGSTRIFTTWDGKSAHPHSFNTWLRRFVIRTKLPPISPHMFRHMAATYLITGGTDIRTVSGKLGHAQTSTTMNIYSHLLKSAEKETANTMQDIINKATQTSQ